MQSTLGKIKKITDLRSVWAHEECDFSSSLSEEDNEKNMRGMSKSE